MRSFFKHFTGSTVFTVLALVAAFILGWETQQTIAAGLASLFTALMLGILETSLSFDNAVVNARILGGMGPFWRRMYLTVGMFISVFGMRILFPLVIVWLVGNQDFGQVVAMTWTDPQRFQEILVHQHVVVAGFGGAFLWMVFAKFFFDAEKEVHWVPGLEKIMGRIGKVESFAVVVTLLVTWGFFSALSEEHRLPFLLAALLGVIVYLSVAGIGALMHNDKLPQAAGLGTFLYLEVQDASFSFDGVIGAFAITNNLFIIALGLGIGAFFVRSMTLKLVDDGTLGAFRYLEHGAFWAIGALATIMFLGAAGVEVPEVVAGSAGLILIGLSFLASVVHNRKSRAPSP